MSRSMFVSKLKFRIHWQHSRALVPGRISQTCATPQWRNAFLTLSLAACPAVGVAQTSAEFDPLVLPGTVLLCRSLPTSPADSAAFAFEYVDGGGAGVQRTSFAAFDSVGQPLYMMVSAKGQHMGFMHNVVVRFSPKGAGERVVLHSQRPPQTPPVGGPDSIDRSKPVEESLTDVEIARAKALAKWFWVHRCKSSFDGKRTAA